VAERQADLRLQALAAREISRALRVAEVVRDRLLAEDVLAGFERRPGELEVRVARRADVDGVDAVAREELVRVGRDGRNVELASGLARPIDVGVRDRDDAAALIAAIAGQMRAAGPGAGAEDGDSDDAVCVHEAT